ncbi:MAG: MFS transporter [Smithellaceae bacterium]|nr:MFS transporter [Syntrophaceae bacterium]MDD4242381.1 MFS transporter [Smithellaceae bacterium]NLX50933.1 MFS transporter [Deltaproteobacteria bacterium]
MTNDRNAREQYPTGGWRAHYVLIVCTLLYIINYMDRQVFSVILQPMKIDLGLSDAQCGLASTVLIFGMAFFSFPIAYLIDRWSRRKAIALMAILWSAATFATGLARNFAAVLIPRFFVGLGEAGFVPGGTAMISASYPKERRGWAMGIFHIAIPLGAAAGVILGGILSVTYGWRTAFLFFAVPGVILGLLAFFMKDYKTAEQPDTAGGIRGFFMALVDVLKLPTMRWYYLGLGIAVFMTSSFLVWLPSLMMRMLHITEATAGMITGGIGLTAIIGAPLGGFLADFWQKRNPRGRMYIPVVAYIFGGAMLILAVLTHFSYLGIALAALFGIASAMAMPAIAAISQDVVPVAHKGLSMGLAIFAQYMLGGAWGPYIVGFVSDKLGGGAEGLGMAIMLCGLFGIVAGILFFVASRTYPEDLQKVKHETILAE